MPRKRHGVRHGFQRLHGRRIRLRAGCGAAPRIVREEVERLLRIKRLAILRKPFIGGDIPRLAFLPFRTDEIISLDSAAADWCERLVERLLPALLHSELNEGLILGIALHVHIERHVSIPVAVIIVVAGAEKLFDLTSVGSAVVRKHAVPGIGKIFVAALESPVRKVACHHHGVNLAVAEILKRTDEHLRRFRRCDMNVAYHTENEIGLLAANSKRTASAYAHESHCSTEKTSSVYHNHLCISLFY